MYIVVPPRNPGRVVAARGRIVGRGMAFGNADYGLYNTILVAGAGEEMKKRHDRGRSDR
jgi:hypothetical protein